MFTDNEKDDVLKQIFKAGGCIEVSIHRDTPLKDIFLVMVNEGYLYKDGGPGSGFGNMGKLCLTEKGRAVLVDDGGLAAKSELRKLQLIKEDQEAEKRRLEIEDLRHKNRFKWVLFAVIIISAIAAVIMIFK